MQGMDSEPRALSAVACFYHQPLVVHSGPDEARVEAVAQSRVGVPGSGPRVGTELRNRVPDSWSPGPQPGTQGSPGHP